MPNPNNLNILAGVGPSALAYFSAVDTAGPVGSAGTAGTQTVTITGSPTGGTFTLSVTTVSGVYTTASITAGASLPTSASVQSAIQALPHCSTITVTGTAGGPFTVTVPAALPQTLLTANGAGLTGGTTPSVTVAVGTAGTQTTTMATAAIPASFLCAGWCDQTGLVANVQETSNLVKGFGSTQTLRVLISESARAFDLNFLETNPVVSTIYNRAPWGSLTADTQGHWAVNNGPAVVATYAGIFDLVDGSNHLRAYCPRLQVATIKARNVAAGKEIAYGVSLAALPDATGTAVYEDYVVANLAA